jgi:hypothetical protein
MQYRHFSILLMVILLAGLAGAEPPANPMSLAGVVQDSSGALIVDAQVVLSTSEGNVVAQGVTDKSGSFHFSSVPPGNYSIFAEHPGFRDNRQQVKVSPSMRPQLRIILPVAGVNEEVTVTGADTSTDVTADTAQNQNATVVDREALDRLPVFDQDYILTMSRFLSSDATGTNGVSLVVNGVEANGPGVSASAIQSVKINQDPYSALYSRPGRGRVEITTKGGTPRIHGSGTFLYRDSLFDAQNSFAVTKPSEQRSYFEGSLTGPFSHDKKTSFLASLNKDNDNQEAIVVAVGPSGSINANVPNPTHHYFLSGRVFHDYGQANQFWIGYNYEHRTVENQGVGGTVLAEAGSNTLSYEHEIHMAHTYIFSPKLLNQAQFFAGAADNEIHSLNENPQLSVSGYFTGGGAQADFRRTEYHFGGADIVTYSAKKHEIKFGINVPDISRRGYDDLTKQAGIYSFASLADYQASHPFSYLAQAGQAHVDFWEKTVAGVFEDTLRLKPNFSITAGVRYYWQNYFHDIKHNFAPRVSFAYSPTKKGGTVVRGGAGFFFDRTGPAPIADLLHFNGVLLKRFILENPAYPVTKPSLAGLPTSVVVLDPRQRIPYTIQYSVSIEQQVNAKSSVSVNYVGSRGIDLFRSVDVNAPVPPNYIARPNPSLGQQRELQSDGYQKSNALEISFRGRPVNHLSGQAQYVLGKSYNNTSGIAYFPANSYFPQSDWGRSDNDLRNKFDVLATLDAGKWFNFGAALSTYSGKPVNVTTGNDNNHDGMANDRPVGVPRNTLHGPTYINMDLNLAHDIRLMTWKEGGPIATISVNSFNVLNHPNDVTYIGVVGSPFFGHAVTTLPARRMQLNLEVKF